MTRRGASEAVARPEAPLADSSIFRSGTLEDDAKSNLIGFFRTLIRIAGKHGSAPESQAVRGDQASRYLR